MKADDSYLQPLLEGVKQYVVPLFQRAYSWKKDEWATLWKDLMEIYGSEEERDHFFGALVTLPINMAPVGVNKFLLIDGQQRLTTVFIILALIRDLASASDTMLATQIEELFLINRFEHGPNRYKLLPTQADRATFMHMIDKELLPTDGQIDNAVEYFRARLQEVHPETKIPLDLNHLRITLLTRFSVVSVVLDPKENPYRIFESLNGKGRRLTQADLVRNYFFMQIPEVAVQNKVYTDYWQPMDQALGERLTYFFFRYLTKDGKWVRQDDIYDEVKGRLGTGKPEKVIDELKTLNRSAGYYRRLLEPAHEPNPDIRRRLERLNHWESSAAYPFLLAAYADYAEHSITSDELVRVLWAVESYMVRRFFCRVPTRPLNRIFIGMHKAMKDKADFVAAAQSYLAEREWPSNSDFLEGIERTPLYSSGTTKCRHILDALEQHLTKNHEPVNLLHERITIEHIMPQTLMPQWQTELGEEWKTVHSTHVHTLGNLTLTGLNEPMGNKSFEHKLEVYQESNFALNQSLAKWRHWDGETIRKRGRDLGKVACEIWKAPGSC